MKVTYDSKYDVLYLKFVEGKKQVTNRNLTEDSTVDIDRDGKIAGIEILDASEHIDLGKPLPVKIAAKSVAKSAQPGHFCWSRFVTSSPEFDEAIDKKGSGKT